MPKVSGAQRRVCCPRCGSRRALGWSVVDWTRYVCPGCGTFKVADRVAETLSEPNVPDKVKRFRSDGTLNRWLVVE